MSVEQPCNPSCEQFGWDDMCSCVRKEVLTNPVVDERQQKEESIYEANIRRGTESLEAQAKDYADPWAHRSTQMRCRTCMWYVNKEAAATDQGRCRRHAPTMNGYPVVIGGLDWCGDHKLA